MRRAVVLVLVLAAAAAAQDPGLAPPRKRPRTSEDVKKVLEETAVTVALDAASLEKALDLLREKADLIVAVDSAVVAPAITIASQDMSVGKALKVIVESDEECVAEVWRGAIIVTRRAAPLPLPPEPDLTDAARKLWDTKRVSLSFCDTPIAQVAAALAEASGLALRAANTMEKLTLRGEDVPLGVALDLACRLAHLKLARHGDALELCPVAPEDKPRAPETPLPCLTAVEKKLDAAITFQFVETPLSEIILYFQDVAGVEFDLDGEIEQDQTVTLNGRGTKARDALGKILEQVGCTFEVHETWISVKKKR